MAKQTINNNESGAVVRGKINDNFSELWAEVFPTQYPTLTNPSTIFTASITGFREIGESVNISFSADLNRGSINPQYTATSPYRSGVANNVNFTETGLTDAPSPTLPVTQTVSGHIVTAGAQSWSAAIGYDEGAQPKDSAGGDYDSPLPAGTTASVTRTITGVYPVFATTSNITTMTKQTLVAHNSSVSYTFAGESGADKQSIEFPEVWSPIAVIEQYNPFSSSWDTLDIGSFSVTSTTKTIQGAPVNYRKYTHNGATVGSRQLRWRV